jgi:hypothetical protein
VIAVRRKQLGEAHAMATALDEICDRIGGPYPQAPPTKNGEMHPIAGGALGQLSELEASATELNERLMRVVERLNRLV